MAIGTPSAQLPLAPMLTADVGSGVTAKFRTRSWCERHLLLAQGHSRWDPGFKAGRVVTQPTLLVQIALALQPEPTMAEQDCRQEAPGRGEHTTDLHFLFTSRLSPACLPLPPPLPLS